MSPQGLPLPTLPLQGSVTVEENEDGGSDQEPDPEAVQRWVVMVISKIIRINHDFVQGQLTPPECKRFAVQDEACRVVDAANLWQKGELYVHVQIRGSLFFSYHLQHP